MPLRFLARRLPALDWLGRYDRHALLADLAAAVIVTILLVPQSLAYALLAGMPPEAGIYASILPALLYTLLGTSSVLAVGPVAVVSLMTATAIGDVAAQGTADYAVAALTLAALSGVMLLTMGALRMGFLANFLSHPVISGFLSAASILIALSQVKHLAGLPLEGATLPAMLGSLGPHLFDADPTTLVIGGASAAFLFWSRRGLRPLLRRAGLSAEAASVLARTGPVMAVIAGTLAVRSLDLQVAAIGDIPARLPPVTLPGFSPELIAQLAPSALLISVIGFVESVSIAETLGAPKQERIDPNQELLALGAANIGASFTGGYPVTGGLARSVVNADAGAATPAAGAFTAAGLALAVLLLAPALHDLPKAVLAATIFTAILRLVDLPILRRTWTYARSDFAAVALTAAVTLLFGIETGLASGIVLSLLLHLWKTSRPHVAEVGRVPGTAHFRNILRHEVETAPGVLILRIDESLYFANARGLETLIRDRLQDRPAISDVVLMCSAINEIDFSALESLEAVNSRLRAQGIGLHLSEVKGPVMDRLHRSHFLKALNGRVFLSQNDAWAALAGRPLAR